MSNWTEKEISFLRDNLNILSHEEILSNLPNRSWKSVQMKAHKLGLKRGHKLRTYSTAPRKDEQESFWSKVEKMPSGCWEWRACVLTDGYGQVGSRKHRGKRAHRVSYEFKNGPIPDGLVLDHLCCNTICVNPDHLEPVTNQENVIRGYLRKYQKSHAGKFRTIV